MDASQDYKALTLRALRMAAGKSQGDIAREIGVSVTTIGKWDRGETFPSGHPSFLNNVATAYEVDLLALLVAEMAWRKR